MSVKMDAFQFRDDTDDKEHAEASAERHISKQSQLMDSFGSVSGKDNPVRAGSEVSIGESVSGSDVFYRSDGNVEVGEGGTKQDDIDASEIFFRDSQDGIQFRDDSGEDDIDASRQTVVVDRIEFASDERDGGFTATSVENIPQMTVQDSPAAGQNQSEVQVQDGNCESHLIRLRQAGVSMIFADFTKFTLFEKKFEKGTLVQALDKDKKPLMLFLQLGSDLMAYRPLQGSLKIEIPSSVGGRPVKYVHSFFLGGGFNLMKGVKALSFFNNFKVDNLMYVNKGVLNESLKGVQELVLPEGLVALPARLFYHCVALSTIVIPSSVKTVSVDSFAGSCFRDIWFNGACPDGFMCNNGIGLGTRVHYRKEFADSFET